MLAKLDSFPFVMHESHFKQIEEAFTWHYAEHKQLGFDSTYHAVNGLSHKITLKGLLVQQKMGTLDPLIAIADKKEPVRLTTKTDDYYVLINALKRGKDRFYKEGSYSVQSFDITLTRVSSGGGFNVVNMISSLGGVSWQSFT